MNRKAKIAMAQVINDVMEHMGRDCGKNVKTIQDIMNDVHVVNVQVRLINGDKLKWDNMPAYCMKHKAEGFARMLVIDGEMVKIEDKHSNHFIPFDNILSITETDDGQPSYDEFDNKIYIKGTEYPLSDFITGNYTDNKGDEDENV